jgi:hypothetical protein
MTLALNLSCGKCFWLRVTRKSALPDRFLLFCLWTTLSGFKSLPPSNSIPSTTSTYDALRLLPVDLPRNHVVGRGVDSRKQLSLSDLRDAAGSARGLDETGMRHGVPGTPECGEIRMARVAGTSTEW